MSKFGLLFLVLSSVASFQLVGADCRVGCGDVKVKYPFGVDDGCGNPDYRLTCTGTSLQIHSATIQSIDYGTRILKLSSGASGGSCPTQATLPLDIQICGNSAAEVVCLSDYRNCCLQRNGTSSAGCNLYEPLPVAVENATETVNSSALELLWDKSVSAKCTSSGCESSKGVCGYNTGSSSQDFSCICSKSSNTTSSCGGTNNKPIWLSGSLAVAVIVVVLVFGVSLSIYWKWKKNAREDERQDPIFSMDDPKMEIDNLREILSTRRGDPAKLYTLAEIDKATNGFAKERKVGSGGFGTVYKGEFEGGAVLAIKRANQTSRHSSKHFFNEVSVLSQVNNRNLVRLIGCCIDTDVPILVYEYVSNGTLFEHLHKRAEVLSWSNRLRIAIETAEALAYLHSAAYPPIYHRDVKSANILLDDNFTAKVADFGLSRLVPIDATHVSTMVQGTPGYVDPEYHQTYQLTDKSDVYSFGVVLLEIVTGRKPVDFARASRDVNLSVYSVPLIRKGMIEEIIDSRLEAQGNVELINSITSVGDVAVACLSPFREDRPTMKQVLVELLKIRGSAALGRPSFHQHWAEGEVIVADSFSNPSEGISYASATTSSNSREQQSAELTPR